MTVTPADKRRSRIAVETYLDWLATLNPDAFKGNRDTAEELEAKIRDAASQVDRLIYIQRLLSLRELQAKRAEGIELRARFVAEAPVFAEGYGITEQAWRMMGIPFDVLRDAGLATGPAPVERVQTDRPPGKPRVKFTPERARAIMECVGDLGPAKAEAAVAARFGYAPGGARSAIERARKVIKGLEAAPPESLRADRPEDVSAPSNGASDLALSR